jgi:2-hydroxy-6-oxonona-2,4-dienedioate hydrolase
MTVSSAANRPRGTAEWASLRPMAGSTLTSTWRVVAGRWIHARSSTAIGRQPPPIVLVHGVGVSSRYMAELAERLGVNRRVFAPDLPGFGLSDKPPKALTVPDLADALDAWMEAWGVDRACLVGNSFGAQIIVDLAWRYPERVDRLILIGPTMDAEARSVPRFLLRWVRTIAQEPFSLFPTVLRDVIDCGPLRVLATLRYLLADRIEAKLPAVDAPVLALRGERDAIAPQRWVEAVADAAPRGSYLTLPGAVHAANYDAVERLAAVIEDFLAGETHRMVARASA